MKKCRVCQGPFEPKFNSTQVVCDTSCAIKYAATERSRKDVIKARRKETKEGREALKTLSDHVKDTQTIVNRYIRARDDGQPCISCGIETGQFHAGHYLSKGAHPELRFHPDNLNRQCSQCNNIKSGNQAEYRAGLIEKIGIERVEWLEGPHDPAKYTVHELKELQRVYKHKIKSLQTTCP